MPVVVVSIKFHHSTNWTSGCTKRLLFVSIAVAFWLITKLQSIILPELKKSLSMKGIAFELFPFLLVLPVQSNLYLEKIFYFFYSI
jgi:hypothetical protein